MSIIYFLFLSLLTSPSMNEISSGVFHWNDLPVKTSPGRESRKIFEGTSPHFEYLEIHATTQEKGAKPAPPHAQTDIEEVIIVKEGTMKFTMDGEDAILGAGSVILIPPLAMQALQNIGDGPLTYYVMMFRSKTPMNLDRCNSAGGKLFVNADSLPFRSHEKGGRIDYFDRATAMCKQFEMHVTQLNHKGPSHAPHTHLGSEIILMIEGEAEMSINDKPFPGSAGDLFFVRSHDLHGITNVGETPCKYFAFRWE
ncbi:MAG: cupin domain-containing protein [Bacteroidia bacterium]